MCSCDDVVELHVFPCTIFVGGPLNIINDLLTRGIVLRPVGVVFEYELKTWGRDVTGDARIFVFKPHTANVCEMSAKSFTLSEHGHAGVLVVQLEIDMLSEMLWESNSSGYS